MSYKKLFFELNLEIVVWNIHLFLYQKSKFEIVTKESHLFPNEIQSINIFHKSMTKKKKKNLPLWTMTYYQTDLNQPDYL